jgi:hypothetical protein
MVVMDRRLIEQLAELAESFNRIGFQPVICGGLGIYLCFHKAEGQASRIIRATTDIDLMLTGAQVLEQARRQAIAEIITGELGYIVREGREYLHFKKEDDRYLDILAPPIEGVKSDDVRLKLVRSKLHGRLTPEACFIEEGLRTICLIELMPDSGESSGLEVQVPSPINSLLLKLFAFNDRDEGQRQDLERAQAHAWDVYVIIMLTDIDDYYEGRQFLSHHEDSGIIQAARSIVAGKFHEVGQVGWRRVLESSDFYPNLNRREKEARLDEAVRRLLRWFDIDKLEA